MKAELLQAYCNKHGVPLRSKLIGNFSSQMAMASVAPRAYNAVFKNAALRRMANKAVGFHPERTVPLLHGTTLRKWFAKHKTANATTAKPAGGINPFCDEFTNYNDVPLGQKTVLLLEALGYEVMMPPHQESGRMFLSKGLVQKAKEKAVMNVLPLKDLVNGATTIIGIEPSAILTLCDEYPDLVGTERQPAARQLTKNAFLFEEWFARETEKGVMGSGPFTTEPRQVSLHGHCYQKALSSTRFIKQSLSVAANYKVEEIPSGCCGMAGSFGYEKEHYDVSMKIGSLVLFPAINNLNDDVIVAASGTSCRHQIKDGTGRTAKHTAEILFDALVRG